MVHIDRAERTIDQRRRSIARLALLGIFLLAMSLVLLGWATTTGRLYFAGGRQQQQALGYHGFCAVPYGSGSGVVDDFDRTFMDEMTGIDRGLNMQAVVNAALAAESELQRERGVADGPVPFFMEEFELGEGLIDESGEIQEIGSGNSDSGMDEGFSRISIPSFRDGRSGSFLHDFKYNQSLIVDRERRHCFVMPLDRETVLKPRNMYDLILKMNSGFYNIDTEVLRKNMRVVLPPLDDTADVAPRIRKECQLMEIFRLEPFTGRGEWDALWSLMWLDVVIFDKFGFAFLFGTVFKRSTDALPENARYAHFSGRHIVEVDFVNYPQLEQYLTARK